MFERREKKKPIIIKESLKKIQSKNLYSEDAGD
jgi:hypothetical protein